MKISGYNSSLSKRFLDILVVMVGLPVYLLLPLIIFSLLFIFSGLPIFFKQSRIGKDGRKFYLYKFRTMVVGAPKMKKKLLQMNEVDGPVFKIRNDPRFTKFGKILSRTGLDELPQFINVLRGEMSVVGPRPLPTEEAYKLSKKEKVRELVKPGITSSWVTQGSHNLSFDKWMSLDREYVENASFWGDALIILRTMGLMGRFILNL